MVGEYVVKVVDRPVLVFELLKETFSLAYYPNMSSYVDEKLRKQSKSLYRVIRNDCRCFNNLSYTVHLR